MTKSEALKKIEDLKAQIEVEKLKNQIARLEGEIAALRRERNPFVQVPYTWPTVTYGEATSASWPLREVTC